MSSLRLLRLFVICLFASSVATSTALAVILPTVTSVSPTSGSTAGGTIVTITGTNLTGATAVSFGATPGTSVVVNSATSITATSPAGGAGIVDITVTAPGGTSATSAADQFTYVASPTVVSVTPPANATYYFSQNLDFTVNFSAAVTVTGVPTLSLTIGANARTAAYVSGSGTTALLFRYTVQPLELDTDGIAVTSPLVLNGGTINATSGGAAATLTFTPPTTTSVLVSNVSPSLSLITHAGSSTTTTANGTTTNLLPRGALSADGRYLVFSTTSSDLVSGGTDTNAKEDVFLADLVTGTITLVSHNATATDAGDDLSFAPAISADGNWVTYVSAATNIVTSQTGGNQNIFLWKRATDTNYLVSTVSSATEGDSTVVVAGATATLPGAPVATDSSFVYVLYRTQALDAGQTNLYQVKLDVTNPATRTRTLVSHDAANAATAVGTSALTSITGNGQPAMSADGRYVAFLSDAATLVTSQTDTNSSNDLFLWDRTTGNSALVSHIGTSATTTSATGLSTTSGRPAFSADGAWLVWTSRAQNIVTGQVDASASNDDAFLYEVATGTNVLVSRQAGSAVTSSGATNAVGGLPSISSDGRYVTFTATGIANATYGTGTTVAANAGVLYQFDRVAAAANPTNYKLTVLSYVAGGTSASTTVPNNNPAPVLSADGSVAVFGNAAATTQSSITDGNTTGIDASVVLASGATARVATLSATTASTTANATSNRFAVNSDGSVVVALSAATDLVAGVTDANASSDLFLYRHARGTVDTAFSSTPPANGTITAASVAGTLPAGLSINASTGVISGTPTTAGIASVIVTVTTINGTVSTPLAITIGKATLTVTLGNLAATYDGTAKSATASTTTPSLSGGSFAITYAGSATAPTAVGSYAVVARITHADYQGVAYGTLVIAQAPVTVAGLTASNKTYNGDATASLTGTASLSGVVVADTSNVSLAGTPVATFADKVVANGKAVTVTGYSLTGSAAANYALTQPSFTANITTAALTITGVTASNKTYDRGTTATLNTGSAALSGVIGADSVTLVTASATGAFADKTVATGKTVTTAGFSLSGSDATNYALTQPTTTANITAVGLTVTGISAQDKSYDGTTTATVTGTASLSGVISGDTVTLSTGSAAFDTNAVGSGKTVTFTGYGLTGADAANYTLSQPTGTASITAKVLTVAGLSASNKTYNGNATASLTGTASLSGVVGADTSNVSLAGTPVATFADKVVANGKTVTVTGYSLTGSAAANYSLTPPSFTANITAAALTITGVTASNKTYDRGTTATLNTGSAALSGVVGGDTVTLASGSAAGAFADKTVATGKAVTITGFSLSGGDAANYTLTQPAATADITAKALTLTGVTASDKTYDGTTTATLNSGSATLSGVISGDTVTFSGGAGAFDTSAAGSGKTVTITGITLGGGDAGNYTLTQPSATAAITAKGLTVAGVTASNKTYDGGVSATLGGTASLSGVIGGDTGNITLTGTATGTFATKAVGTGKTVSIAGYSLTGSAAGNYTLTQPTTTANITAKSISITGVTASSKEYDGNAVATLNSGAAALSGAAIGDSVSVTTLGATGAFPAKTIGTGLTVSTTGFGLAGADAGNYQLSQPTATADITAKALTVASLTATSRPYNQGTVATLVTGSATLTGIISGDTVTLDSGAAAGAFADKNIGTAKVVTVTGLALAGADAGNYTLTAPAPTADITAVALTVSGITASNKTYDAALGATINTASAVLSAPLGAEVVTLVTGSAAGSFGTKVIGTGKTVTITGLSLTGTDAGNYVITTPTTTADITAAALTVAGVTALDKTYNASAVATLNTGSATLVGAVSGDTVTLSVVSATGAFADKNVGAGKTVTTAGFSVSGADAGNYTLTQPATTASISAQAASITGATVSNKVYDGNATAALSSTGSLVGAIGGDTVTLASGGATAAFSSKAVGTGKTVTFAGFTLTGADAGNYSLSQPTTTADITAKGATIAGTTATNKIYDATTTATAVFTSASLVGIVSGDTVSLVTSGASSTFATKVVGTGKTVTITGLALGGADAGNYSLTQPTTTADITAKELTVSGVTASSRTYDAGVVATLNTSTAALVGVAGADTVTLSTSSVAGAFATKTVGTGKAVTVSGLSISGADAANYTLTQPTTTADITAKGLTVSGTTASNKVYDGALTATPNFTSSALVGVIGGDTVSLVNSSGSATFATKVVATAKTVTIAGLTLSGADAANYSLAQPTTTADITAKSLTVSGITAATRVYDATTVATLTTSGAALVGVVSGDTVALSTGSAAGAFATKTIGTGKTVTVSGLSISGADAANYSLTQPTATADITAKNLTVAGITASSKVYNGNTSASLVLGSASLVGIVSGDTVTLNTSGATGTFSSANAGLNLAVQVAGLVLAGADAGNYTVTQPSTTANITPASVSIAISNTSFTYDGTPKSATITVTPSVSASIVYSNGGSAPINAGTYTVSVNVTDGNYSGSANGSLTIAKATQTLAFTIGGTNFAVGSSLSLNATASSGLPVSFAVVSGTASISGSSVTITQAGPVTIRATQSGGDNYIAVTADQSFTGVSGTKTAQTIAFGPLSNVTTDVASITLSATATSGLPVSFTIVSGPGFLIGTNTVSFTGAPGVMTIRASQAGNDTFAAAPDVTRSFTVANASPDTFFGDLTDDPGTAGDPSRGELIQSGGPRLEAKTGDIAAVIYTGTRRGNIIVVSPLLSLNVSLDFTLNDNGTYTVPFTSAGRSLTLTGTLSGSTLTGHIPALKVSFVTQVLAKSGITANLAGFYDADALNTAKGGTSSIVGPNGQLLIVATAGDFTTGALGSVGADGKFNVSAPGATINGAVDAPTTTVSGTIIIPGQPTVSFSGLSGTTSRTDRLINLSSRVRVGPAAGRTLITGFVIGGGADKRVLLRATGPALTGFGVQGALSNPRLQLYDGTGKLILENDDWSGAETSTAISQVGAFSLVAGSKDAALVTTLKPGAYTMHVIDGGETGVALAEIYDASVNPQSEYQRLINISTRGEAGAGENVLIGGFIITGNAPKTVLVRGVGPGLAAFGVGGTLADPRLRVYGPSGLVAENDNWSTVAAEATATAAAGTQTGAFALVSGSKDAAVILTLNPGAYTAQVSAADGTSTGVALVEIYELPQ
jgi:hypothetical protein